MRISSSDRMVFGIRVISRLKCVMTDEEVGEDNSFDGDSAILLLDLGVFSGIDVM